MEGKFRCLAYPMISYGGPFANEFLFFRSEKRERLRDAKDARLALGNRGLLRPLKVVEASNTSCFRIPPLLSTPYFSYLIS